jgi:diaminopimelate epimerase
VTVPGGSLEVDLSGAEAVLTGPAEVVARGTCTL